MVIEDVEHLVQQANEDVVRWRRHLHENPEVSFEEELTAQFVGCGKRWACGTAANDR